MDEHLNGLRQAVAAEGSDGQELLNDLEHNPICSVALDGEIPCILLKWNRYATSAQLRYVHECLLRLIETGGVSKILADDTALPTIHTQDQRWITSDWMPRAVAAGFRAVATKKPAAYFGRISVENVALEAPTELTIRAFEDLGEARAWLKAFPAEA